MTGAQMGSLASRYSEQLNRVIERLAGIGIWLLVADVSVAVGARYIFSTPLSWAEEVGRYLLIWIAMLTISVGVARRDHPSLSYRTAHLGPIMRTAQIIVEALAASALFLSLLRYGVPFAADGAHQSALSIGTSMLVPNLALPIGAAVSLVQVWLTAVAQLFPSDSEDVIR